MKLPRLPRLALTTLALLAACDHAPAAGDTCDVVAPAFRKLATNGVSMNGVSLNGTSFNGIGLNGVSLNGQLNGVSLNGVSVNGVSLNGSGINGVSLNGSDEGVVAAIDVALEGTALVATTADGTRIAGQAWVGATLPATVGDEIVELEITAVEVDDGLEWYSLAFEGTPLCEGRGLFVAGVWDDTGARHDALADGEFAHSFSCDDGALAKCIDWGYAPFTVGADAHQSCTRMVRADYCGDGTPHTANGTVIDVFDSLGVQQTDASVDLEFEAGWGPNGAMCVSRSRYQEIGSDGDEITAGCWENLPVCDAPEVAFSLGAKLVNRSAEQTLCYED